MTFPVVEVLGDRRATQRPDLLPLLVALRAWCEPRAPEPGSTPDARLAVSTAAPRLPGALEDSVPVAVVLDPAEPFAADQASRAAVLVVREDDDRRDDPSAVVLPREWFDASAHPPVSPFVRARWRRRLGLDPDLCLAIGFVPETTLSDEVRASALAVAAAAAVRGPQTLLALALGTPTVTDRQTAARLGAEPDLQVVVAEDSSAIEAAAQLATDLHRAAGLARAGAELARRHDVRAVARQLVQRLGIGPVSGPGAPLAGLQARLDELRTPPGSRPAVRAVAHAAGLCGGGDWVELTGRRR